MGLFSGIKDTVSGVVGGFTGETQRDAGKDAKKLGKKNAEYIRQETSEQVRRLELAQEQVIAKTKGAQAGSGIELGGGTVDTYIAEMKNNFAKELDWLKKSGKSRAAIAKEGGNVANAQAQAAGWGTAAQSISMLVGWYGPGG